MTALVWDKVGERVFQTGVDRGVLYLADTAVVWNGLTGVEDTPNEDLQSFYLNGVKYLEYLSPGDFSATLKAFTYPSEFDAVNGVLKHASGMRLHDQPAKSFGLSYRTRIGNDLEGTDLAYVIHLLYNIIASPNSAPFATIGESVEPVEFTWALSGRPVRVDDMTWRPTAHVSIDSRDFSDLTMTYLGQVIYGVEFGSDARLPTLDELPTILTLLE